MRPMPLLLSTSLSLTALSLALGCSARPNPRLAEIVASGNLESTTSLTYDDDGRVAKVVDSGGNSTHTLELRWKDGQLGKISSTVENLGDEPIVRDSVFEYEGERIVGLETTGNDDFTSSSTVAYDDQGRLARMVQSAVVFGRDSVDTTEFRREEGRLVAIDSSSSLTGGGEPDEEFSGTTTIVYADGLVSKMDTASGEFRATYDDEDRLARIEIVSDQSAESVNVEYEYDDEGRLAKAVATNGDETTTNIDYTYDEGEAKDLDVASYEATRGMWDAHGGSHSDIDVRTQLPRLLGASW